MANMANPEPLTQRQFTGALAVIDAVQRATAVAVAVHLLGVADTEFNTQSAMAALLEGNVDADALLRQLYNVYAALVYAVVEGWLGIGCEWDAFSNERVAELLADTDLILMRRYRNTVFHAIPMTDPRHVAFLEQFEEQGALYYRIIDAICDALAPLIKATAGQ